MGALLAILKPLSKSRNLHERERLLSGGAATVLLLWGLEEKKWRGWLMFLLGLGLYARAFTGRSKRYALPRASNNARFSPRLARRGLPKGRGIHLERTLRINRPVSEVFRVWRNFENLPNFMDHLERVQVTGPTRSHWVARAAAGLRIAWDAEIVEERSNALICWESLPGSDVDNAGKVAFREVDGGTELGIVLDYNPPCGRPGVALAKLFHKEPGRQIDADLMHFKRLMEIGG